jgi:mono/diheme cytochrome c family protein
MKAITWPLLALITLTLSACERAKQDMYDQARGKPYRASTLFPDGNMSRTPPPGTVPYAQGAGALASSARVGADDTLKQAQADAAPAMPFPITPALLRRGQDRYAIYCMPCHSAVGDGDGRIVRRGFPAPPSYHQDRLRQAPDRHVYDVISQGFGAMRPYGDRIKPEDRWAIVAFVRALQLSQHAQVDSLPPDVRQQALRQLSQATPGAAPDASTTPEPPPAAKATHGAPDAGQAGATHAR